MLAAARGTPAPANLTQPSHPTHPWRQDRSNSKGAGKGDGGGKGKGKGKDTSSERSTKRGPAGTASSGLDDTFAARCEKASAATGDTKAALDLQLSQLKATFQSLEVESSTKDAEPTGATLPTKERFNRELVPLQQKVASCTKACDQLEESIETARGLANWHVEQAYEYGEQANELDAKAAGARAELDEAIAAQQECTARLQAKHQESAAKASVAAFKRAAADNEGLSTSIDALKAQGEALYSQLGPGQAEMLKTILSGAFALCPGGDFAPSPPPVTVVDGSEQLVPFERLDFEGDGGLGGFEVGSDDEMPSGGSTPKRGSSENGTTASRRRGTSARCLSQASKAKLLKLESAGLGQQTKAGVRNASLKARTANAVAIAAAAVAKASKQAEATSEFAEVRGQLG